MYWTASSSLDVLGEAYFRFSLLASSLASLGLGLVRFLEQRRPHRLSHLATRYLLVSVLCDVVYLVAYLMLPSDLAGHATLSRPVLLRCLMQSTLLIFEYGTQGPAALEVSCSHQSPKEHHGLSSRLLFLWINPILLQGYKDIFTQADMPQLNQDMMPDSTRKAMVEIWAQRGEQRSLNIAYRLASHMWNRQTRNAEESAPGFTEVPENTIFFCCCAATFLNRLPVCAAHFD